MRIRNLIVRYGATTALDIGELTLKRGVCYAVIGANGCGKSTLARCIAGVIKPTSGEVGLQSDDKVRYMPQHSYAFYGSTLSNVMLGVNATAHGKERARMLIDALNLTTVARQGAKQLSGGQTARMALARTLVGQGTWLVLDEPTAALDSGSMLAAEGLIRSYRDEFDAGVILITHSLKQAKRVSDQLVFMENGHVVEQGETKRLIDDPQTPALTRFLELFGA